MLIVEWTEEALDDLDNIIEYIVQFNAVAAYDLEDHLFESAKNLVHHPYMGKDGRSVATREFLAHPNYWLVYEVTDKISILNVIHTRKLYPKD